MTTHALVAVTPTEMAIASKELIGWIERKIQVVTAELKEAREALRSAIEHKWAVTALRSAVNRLERRLTFYDKVKAATEAGYVIMPSLPMNVIAIRTKARNPVGQSRSAWDPFRQQPQALPQGAGENKNPIPLKDCASETEVKDGKQVTVTDYWAADFAEDLVMPVELCKPVVLERTQEALALKLFDEVGVVRDERYNGDPIVVGNIIDPTRGRRRISFFIAWVLPLADL